MIDSIGPPHIPGDNPLTIEGIALGRRLFHDPLLSDDQSISCASCHLQENGFADPRQFSVGTDGSLGGRRHSLEDQALDPVIDPAEMRNTWPTVIERLRADPDYVGMFRRAFGNAPIDQTLVVKAIAQFERTLVSFGSPFDRYRFEGDALALTPAAERGMRLFFRDAHC
ncbi:MAG: cytochrome-c peroxidase, partial [Flavobacteriales bacterium]|nr:cytochrome-c peroxidase [Flavobacteriales bacterium]